MQDYLLVIGLLSVPFFLRNVKVFRKGLVTGLFISLFFWSKLNFLLIVVPLSALVTMSLIKSKDTNLQPMEYHYIKNPAFPMIVLFIASMAVFSAFDGVYLTYGSYLNLSNTTLEISQSIGVIGYMAGPIILGYWYDRQGPFSSAILLTFIAEYSVLMAACGQNRPYLLAIGNFFMHFCSAGFFLVIPMIITVIYGENSLEKVYPKMALLTLFCWVIARIVYLNYWNAYSKPWEFLIGLTLLTMVSALFIFVAWRKRFTLVIEKKRKV